MMQRTTFYCGLDSPMRRDNCMHFWISLQVEALRRRHVPLSSKAAGRIGRYDRPKNIPIGKITSLRLTQFFAKL